MSDRWSRARNRSAIGRYGVVRASAVAAAVVLCAMACGREDGATASRLETTVAVTTASTSAVTSSAAEKAPSLLNAQTLAGEWRTIDAPLNRAQVCGDEIPSPRGEVSSQHIDLLREPEQDAVVSHTLAGYASAGAAAAAMDAFSAIAKTCRHFTREGDPGGPSEVDLSPMEVPGFEAAIAVLLSITWADGTGQGFALACIRHGRTVSCVGVDAPQGGIPRPADVRLYVGLVEAG